MSIVCPRAQCKPKRGLCNCEMIVFMLIAVVGVYFLVLRFI
jgi:hypothetical protein